jgi:hypothetical protein
VRQKSHETPSNGDVPPKSYLRDHSTSQISKVNTKCILFPSRIVLAYAVHDTSFIAGAISREVVY